MPIGYQLAGRRQLPTSEVDIPNVRRASGLAASGSQRAGSIPALPQESRKSGVISALPDDDALLFRQIHRIFRADVERLEELFHVA